MTIPTLLDVLFLKPALVLAVAALITAGLRRQTAAARHAVWAGSIIATLALPIMIVALPPLHIPALLNAIEWLLPGATQSGSAPPTTGRDLAAKGTRPGNGVLDSVRLGGAGQVDWLPETIVAFWILGTSLLATRRVIAGVRVRRIVRRGRPISNSRRKRLFTEIARAYGMRRAMILLSDETPSPAVTGVLRPIVLLPAAAGAWAEADFTAVLLHELGHVARRDCLLNFLGDLATVIYWCNPALRLAVRRMRAEGESACDDRVLRGGVEPDGYARLLLTVARAARMNGRFPEAAIAMARPHELESRLRAVLDPSVPRNPLPRWMPAALGGVGILFALPTAALTLRVAPSTTAERMAPEPDLLADSLAQPASERLLVAPDAYRVPRGAARALAGPDSALVERLVDALAHEPVDDEDLIRERATWALQQASDGRLVEPLIAALDARDWRVQAYSAWALATARDPRPVPRLVSLLGSSVWRLRAMAAYALREAEDPRAEEAMNTALTDPAWQVRVEAVKYFAALGGPALSERLRPRLDDRHVVVRHAAERAFTL